MSSVVPSLASGMPRTICSIRSGGTEERVAGVSVGPGAIAFTPNVHRGPSRALGDTVMALVAAFETL